MLLDKRFALKEGQRRHQFLTRQAALRKLLSLPGELMVSPTISTTSTAYLTAFVSQLHSKILSTFSLLACLAARLTREEEEFSIRHSRILARRHS